MKLTRHERKVVSKINTGEIYDIPSYLRSFGKGREQTYDMGVIRSKFADDENGKKYKVLKDGHSLFVTTYSSQEFMGHQLNVPRLLSRPESNITDDEWTLCEAKLNENIPPSRFTYDEREFCVDFQRGAFVADNFNDILTFIRLWAYLRHENLVFEVSKPVSQDEISMLYEEVPCSSKRLPIGEEIKLAKHSDKDEDAETLVPVKSIYQTIPTRNATEFMDKKWEINEDHLMMCREFLGKKMYPTGASHNFAANNYCTSEEMHRGLNTVVAVVALLISVLSFSFGLLYPNNVYQHALDNLTQQLTGIQETLDSINTNQTHYEDIAQICEKIESMEESLRSAEHIGVFSEISEVNTHIGEIRNILAEMFLPED